MADAPSLAELENHIVNIKTALSALHATRNKTRDSEAAKVLDGEIDELEKELKPLQEDKKKLLVRGNKVADEMVDEVKDDEQAEDERSKAVSGASGNAGETSKSSAKSSSLFSRTKRVLGKKVDVKLPRHPWFVALLALVPHAWDVANGFDRSSNILIIIALYAFFTLYVIFFYKKSYFTTESGTYLGISLFAFALPYVLKIQYVQETYIPVIFIFMPIWFLYIALNEPDTIWLNRIGRGLVFLICLALLIVALGSLSLPNVFLSSGVNLGQPLQRFWTDLTDSWTKIKNNLMAGGLFNWQIWQQKINATFNPYAQFYAGQVEQNTQEPTGVYITKLNSLYPTTYVGTDPVIMGRVEAKTFLPYTIRLTPSCRLERPSHNFVGIPDPDPAKAGNELDVNYQLIRDITCTFPHAPNMTAGSYNGVLGITFPYETWAYATETFVSRDLLQSYLSQGRDINRDLDITTPAIAIYTNGPVEVGVNQEDQPIDIDLNAQNNRYIQQHFGFTLTNRWTQGSIKEDTVSADVIVPEPFELQACAPTNTTSTDEVNGTHVYHFNRSQALQLDPRLGYSTVTCQLVLPTRAAAEQVLSFGEKTPVTFVVIAKYTYEIEQKVPVKISQ